MISEAFALKYDAEAEVPFKDIAKEKWHFTYVQALVANGVTKGKTKDTFAPDQKVKRGELAAFISRAKWQLKKDLQ